MRVMLPLVLGLFLVVTAAAPAWAAGYATDSEGVLYQVIPDQASIERVGPVKVVTKLADGRTQTVQPSLTDLALSDLHGLYGISYDTLYRIDFRDPAKSEKIGPLRKNGFGSFNALAFDDKGRLFALEGGTLHQVDLKTGLATALGSLGSNWFSDGDLAWVGDALYATVNGGVSSACHLVRIDMKTWKASDVGAIRRQARVRGDAPKNDAKGKGGSAPAPKGDAPKAETPKGDSKAKRRDVTLRVFRDVWGLIWTGDELYGVTPQGELIQIDYKSGSAIVVTKVKATFYGSCAMLRI